MKKRLLSWLLVLVMVLGMLPANAFAADLLTGYNFSLNADKDVIQAGESVTLTVELDNTIPVSAGATMIQFELWYDSTVVKETSITNGPDYAHVPTGGAENDFGEIGKGVTTFGWSADDSEPVEFPAGTLATIVYTAVEDIEVESLQTTFALELYVCDYISQDLVVATPEVEITVQKSAGSVAEKDYPFTITVDGEEIIAVASGTEYCETSYSQTAPVYVVTVPAGTQSVTIANDEAFVLKKGEYEYIIMYENICRRHRRSWYIGIKPSSNIDRCRRLRRNRTQHTSDNRWHTTILGNILHSRHHISSSRLRIRQLEQRLDLIGRRNMESRFNRIRFVIHMDGKSTFRQRQGSDSNVDNSKQRT